MNRSSLSMFSIAVVGACAAACGGKSSATPKHPGSGHGAATPFDQAAVRASLAATPQSSAPECGDPATVSTTLGDLFKTQGDALVPNDIDFACAPDLATDGQWECTWSVFAKPAGPITADDPCGGGSAGFQIIAKVGVDGVIVPGTITCVAPG